jgi:hypothetical protein
MKKRIYVGEVTARQAAAIGENLVGRFNSTRVAGRDVRRLVCTSVDWSIPPGIEGYTWNPADQPGVVEVTLQYVPRDYGKAIFLDGAGMPIGAVDLHGAADFRPYLEGLRDVTPSRLAEFKTKLKEMLRRSGMRFGWGVYSRGSSPASSSAVPSSSGSLPSS